MRIGIMGGTFNPPHTGHINAALAARREIPLDEIIFVPAGTPPHKEIAKNSASTAQRLAMACLAAESIGCSVSDIEIKRGGKSYTFDTVCELERMYPGSELWLITGTDMFLSLESWYRAEELLKKVNIAAVPRETDDVEKLWKHGEYLEEKYGTKLHISTAAAVEISSTELREEKNIKYIPDAVYKYIEENGLYK